MKTFLLLFLSLFVFILFSPTDAFACACCADPGYYRIRVSKPGSFETDILKKFEFRNAQIYSTAGFPEDVKGLDPVSEEYQISASLTGDGWDFSMKDKNGKEGTLKLKMPKTFVDFAVDTREGEKGGAGSVLLYKEWRFLYKVEEGTGIFRDGVKGKTEYFLVLQGKGNACNSAEDYTHWRLEVTGKNASYAFYGDLGSADPESASGNAASDDSLNADLRSEDEEDDPELVSNLTGTDYSGCGCSGITLKEAKKKGEKRLFYWSEFKQNPDEETVFINIDGKDTELKLLVKGERPEVLKVGDRFSDEYSIKGTKLVLDYTVTKLPCEECEGTDYYVTATIIGEFSGKVVSLSGSCGC
ncbi:MAG: hypothetical protein R2681_02495 [Pyrinomonadaceae bacterium]